MKKLQSLQVINDSANKLPNVGYVCYSGSNIAASVKLVVAREKKALSVFGGIINRNVVFYPEGRTVRLKSPFF